MDFSADKDGTHSPAVFSLSSARLFESRFDLLPILDRFKGGSPSMLDVDWLQFQLQYLFRCLSA